VRLRSHEDAAHHIKAECAADVSQQMIVAHKIAAGKCAASGERLIKADAFAAAAGHQFHLNHFSDLLGIEKVEVVQDRPIGLESLVEGLTGAPGYFGLKPDVVLENKITTETEKGPTAKGLRRVVP